MGDGGGGCLSFRQGLKDDPVLHQAGELREVEFFSQNLFFMWENPPPFNFLGLLGNLLKSECFISILSFRMPQQQCQSFLPFNLILSY